MDGLIPFPKDEKLPLRYPGVVNIVQEAANRPVADYVTRAIDHQAYLDDVERFKDQPAELRPDTTPNTSTGLGQALWGLITAIAP